MRNVQLYSHCILILLRTALQFHERTKAVNVIIAALQAAIVMAKAGGLFGIMVRPIMVACVPAMVMFIRALASAISTSFTLALKYRCTPSRVPLAPFAPRQAPKAAAIACRARPGSIAQAWARRFPCHARPARGATKQVEQCRAQNYVPRGTIVQVDRQHATARDRKDTCNSMALRTFRFPSRYPQLTLPRN